jgi:tetratricopeptide (TPR) repeat protein
VLAAPAAAAETTEPEPSEEAPASQDTEENTTEPSAENDARELLRLARLRFERGEYTQAVDSFSRILGTPVRLLNRRDLHEGFLYYAFTLLLMGDEESASDALLTALRLDPDFAPSPVTTRPDIYAFYERRQAEFNQSQGGVAEATEAIFPELADKPGASVVLQRQRFVPLLGIGLRQLGHARIGNILLGTEIGAFSLNIASLILRAAYIEDRTPAGMIQTAISREMTYVSFGVFWGAMLADFVVSMALRRYYVLHPEKRRTRGSQADRVPPRRPQLRAGPTSLTLSFW